MIYTCENVCVCGDVRGRSYLTVSYLREEQLYA